jgi:aminobenzoyl-glutamate utilization protein A
MDLGLWAETSDVQKYVRGRVHEILRGAAAAAAVELDVRHIGEAPSARPDPDLAAFAREVASALPDIHRIDDFVICRAGEDATVMLERVTARGGRGIYVLVGTPIGTGHHTPEFDIDERALGIGTAWLTGIATRLLTRERSGRKGTP